MLPPKFEIIPIFSKGPCIIKVLVEGNWGAFEICYLFSDSVVLKKKPFFYFWGGGGGGGGDHKIGLFLWTS